MNMKKNSQNSGFVARPGVVVVVEEGGMGMAEGAGGWEGGW